MLEKYANGMIESETAELRYMIELVTKNIAIAPSPETGKLQTSIGLGIFEIEALVMRIPAECLRLQGEINRFSTRNAFKDLSIDGKVAKALDDLRGEKGTAEERKKKAELSCIDERGLNVVNKMMVKGLQSYIDRADKVYEGLKKVLDYRSKEGYFDRRGPN